MVGSIHCELFNARNGQVICNKKNLDQQGNSMTI